MPWSEYWTMLLQWVIIPFIVVSVITGGALEIWESLKRDKDK